MKILPTSRTVYAGCALLICVCLAACSRPAAGPGRSTAVAPQAPAPADAAERAARAAHVGFASSDSQQPASLRAVRAMEQDFGAQLGFEQVTRSMLSGDRFLLGLPPPGTEHLTMAKIGREHVLIPINRLLAQPYAGDETGPVAVQNGFLLVSILAYCRPDEADLNGEVAEKLVAVKWVAHAKPGALSLLNEMNAKGCLSPESFALTEPLARDIADSLSGQKGELFVASLEALARYYFDLIPAGQLARLTAAQLPGGGFNFDGIDASGTAAMYGAHVLALWLRASDPAAAKAALETAQKAVYQAKLVKSPQRASVEPGLPR